MDAISQGVILIAADGRYVEVNPAAERILGLDRETLLSCALPEPWSGVTAADGSPLAGDAFPGLVALRTGTSVPRSTIGWFREDGSAVWTEVAADPLPGGGALVSFEDITTVFLAKRRAEADLLEREELYRTFFEYGPDGIVVLDPATARPLQFNDQVCRQLGYTREEFKDLSLADIEAMETVEDTAQRIKGVLETGSAEFETRQRTKCGEVRDVLVTAKHLQAGGMSAYHCVWRDITERKKVEAELRESEARFKALHNASFGGISIHDQGVILECNQGLSEMTGYSTNELIGMNGLLLIAPDSRDFVLSKITSGYESPYESFGIRKNGEIYPMQLEGRNVLYKGKMVRTVEFRDITERRQAEAERAKLQTQLQQSQKMESLGTLAGGVAHDMNNVLGAILGLAEANLDCQPPGSPGHTAFSIIVQAAERGGKMVKRLLGFARQTLPEETEVDLNAILRDEIQMLERTTFSRIRLNLELAGNLRPVRGDPSALTHAFMNLCVNAVDAMPDGGTLTLVTREVDNDWIEVLVEDTGTGMPKEVLEKALDPFFTTKGVGKGTGLGLSLVYNTVKAHQGQIEIRSSPGHGTCVRMRFPASEPVCQTSGPLPSPPSARQLGALDVLLVDDDELIQRSSEMLLETLGHTVTTVSSGEEALARLEAGFLPDLVILDMNMPGMGGAGTLPRLRALNPRVPVLLATGRADHVALDLVAGHPPAALLSKPFGLGELREHLQEAHKFHA